MTFDIDGARAAGYSDSEIADHLKSSGSTFDFDGARQAGYSDTEIVDGLRPAAPAPAPQRPKRNLFAIANDTVIETANAAAGAVKAVGDFIVPGNRVSRAIGNLIERGEQSQSDNTRQRKAELNQNIEQADGFGEEAGAFLRYAVENPDLAAAQVAGSVVVPAGAVRGGTVAARGLGFGAKGMVAGGTAGGAAAGASMGGGDAAGNAYDLVMETPDEVVQRSPLWAEMERDGVPREQIKERLAQAAGRDASIVPAIVGAVAGTLGFERVLAGGRGFGGNAVSRALKTGASEAAQEAVEEGVTGYSGRQAAAEINPDIDPMKGLGAEAAGGAVLGFVPGAVVGAANNRAAPAPAPAVDATTVLDAEAGSSTTTPLALPAPRIIVNERGQAVREGTGTVFDEAPARVVGRAPTREDLQGELLALGLTPDNRATPTPVTVDSSGTAITDDQMPAARAAQRQAEIDATSIEPQANVVGRAPVEIDPLTGLPFEPANRSTPTPIRVDGQGNATTDAQTAPAPVADGSIDPQANVVGRAPVQPTVAAELGALGLEPTQRASATPIRVDGDGNAALDGDRRSPEQAERDVIDEEAMRLFPRDAKRRAEWALAERERRAGDDRRMRALAERSNARKAARGVPIVQQSQQASSRNVDATAELGVVRRAEADGNTTYFFATQPEAALVVRNSDTFDARQIVSISEQGQGALLRAALADGALEAGPRTISRSALREVPGAATDRLGVTRLVGRDSDSARLAAELNREATSQALSAAEKKLTDPEDIEVASQAIMSDPRAASQALRRGERDEIMPRLRRIAGLEPEQSQDAPADASGTESQALMGVDAEEIDPGASVDLSPVIEFDSLLGDPIYMGDPRGTTFFELDAEQRQAVGSALRDIFAMGVPRDWLNGLRGFFANSDQYPGGRLNYFRTVSGRPLRAISFKTTGMGSVVPGPNATEAEQKEFRGQLIHELAHNADNDGTAMRSSNDPRMTVISGAEVEAEGDVAREVFELFADGRSPMLQKLFAYPLRSAIIAARSGKPHPAAILQSEIHAQLMRAYFTNRAELQQHAPKAYEYATSQVGDAVAVRAPGEAGGAVRGEVRQERPDRTGDDERRPVGGSDANRTDDRQDSAGPGAGAAPGRVRDERAGGVARIALGGGEVAALSNRMSRLQELAPSATLTGNTLQVSREEEATARAFMAGVIEGSQNATEQRTAEVRPEPTRDGGGRQARRGPAPLEGAPTVAGAAGPDARLVEVAEQYARENGLTLTRQAVYATVDEQRATRIAQAYDEMQHAPQDAAVREAYENLIRQTVAQYRALEAAGYQFYFFDSSNDPYDGNPWNAMRDIRANQRMGVFATEAGFGSGATELNVEDNPLLADTGITWPWGSLDGEPKRVLANDLFRAVHDAFGHGLEGSGFRAQGEENAWQAHARLFTGSALGALTSETRGQNSWLNYGPYGERNRNASVEDTVFADQKTGLMPEWTWQEGIVGDEEASPAVLRMGRRRREMQEPDDLFGEEVGDRGAMVMNWIIQAPTDARKALGLPSFREARSITKRAFGEAVDKYRRGKIRPSDNSARARERLATALADEVQWYTQYAQDSGIDWYGVKFQRAIDELAKADPSLRDADNRGLFTALLAITSDGTEVSENLGHAMRMYEAYQRGDTLAGSAPGGQYAASFQKNATLLDDMIRDLGLRGTLDALLMPMLVAEVKIEMAAFGEKSPANDYPDDAMLPRAAVFLGPKLGAFYANLMGETGYLTMDRWWNRTINRYRGHMAATATDSSLDTLRELTGSDLSDEKLLEMAEQMSRERQRKYEEARARGERYNATKAETLATTIHKNAQVELNDSPLGKADRAFQIAVVNRAKELLAERGIAADVAGIQATIWYYEKELFESIGVKGRGRISYEEAARNWVGKRGQSAARDAAGDAAGQDARARAQREQQGGETLDLFADPQVLRARRQGGLNESGQGASQVPGNRQARPGQRAASGTRDNSIAAELEAMARGTDRSPQGLVEAFISAASRDAGRPVSIRLLTPEAGSPAERLISDVRERMGIDLVVFASSDPDVPLGASLRAVPRAIFVSGRVARPEFVIGHELLHELRKAHPDLYATLVSRLRQRVVDTRANADVITAEYNLDGLQGNLPSTLVEEENMADVAGTAFADPAFRDALAAAMEPSKLKQLFRWIGRWFQRVFGNLPTRDLSVESDVDAVARDMLEDIAEAYAAMGRRNAAVRSVSADANLGAVNVRRSGTGRARAAAAPAPRAEPDRVTRAVTSATLAASAVASPVTATLQAANTMVDNITSTIARATGIQRVGQATVNTVRKAVHARSSWGWVERVKQGLIADFGIPEEYLAQKVEKQARENKLLRNASHLLDRMSDMSPDQLAVAYQWLQEKPDTAREAELLGKLSPAQRQTMQQVKADVDKLSREAVALGLITQETYERNKMAYIHRSYKKYEAELTQSQLAVRQRAQRLKGDQFKGRGMELEVELDRIRGDAPDELKGAMVEMLESRDAAGKLLRREFLVQGQPRPAALRDYASAGIWEIRGVAKSGKLTVWRDFTHAERQRMGEIEDARYGFARTMLAGVRDVETARFLGWVGRQYGQKSKDGLEVVELQPLQQALGTQTFTRDQWVKVPDTKIADTDVKRYGELAGMHIPGVMWNDLMALGDFQNTTWDKLLSAWKISKTALSPAVHVNNVMSNFIMADLADIGVNDIRRALDVIVKYKQGDAASRALVERYQDSGAEAGSFAANEMRSEVIEPLLRQIAESEPEVVQRASLAQVVSLAAHGKLGQAAVSAARTLPGRVIGGTIEGMLAAYQSEDSVFRLAKFINEVEAGASDVEAGRAARQAFLDYNVNAPWVRAARRSVLPFISFTYRAIPLLAEAALTKPWKFAKYLALGHVLSMLAYGMLGDEGDEEREQRLLPDDMGGTSVLGLPKLLRMPWNDKDSDPVWLDVRRWLPGADVAELGNSKAAIPVPTWLTVGGPLTLLIDFYSNTNFNGDPIVNETDSAAQKVEKVADTVLKFALPNLPLPGLGSAMRFVGADVDQGNLDPYAWASLERTLSGARSITGKTEELATTLPNVLGVKLDSRRLAEEVIFHGFDYQAKEREIRAQITRIANQGARGRIDRDEMQRRIRAEVDKLTELGRETGEKLRR